MPGGQQPLIHVQEHDRARERRRQRPGPVEQRGNRRPRHRLRGAGSDQHPAAEPKNPINLGDKADIPVAVLTTQAGEYGLPLAFDATKIDSDQRALRPGGHRVRRERRSVREPRQGPSSALVRDCDEVTRTPTSTCCCTSRPSRPASAQRHRGLHQGRLDRRRRQRAQVLRLRLDRNRAVTTSCASSRGQAAHARLV